MLVPALLFAVVGLIVASFAAAVADRVPRCHSPLAGRSRGESCGETVALFDNVPVLSWLALGGRCWRCSAPISTLHPLAEIAVAAGFIGSYLSFSWDGTSRVALDCVFVAVLATVTLTDLAHRIIPNVVLGPAAVVGVALIALSDPGALPRHLLAAVIAGTLLLVVALAYPRGMGMGDVKLAAVIGLYLGRAVAPALLIGFALGAVYGLVLIARHGVAARKRAIPFGPFLAAGALVGLFAGDGIVDWYLQAFIDG